MPVGAVSTALAESHDHQAVTIKSYAYDPNPFTVQVGDTVVWTNEDSAPHTVTSASGPTKLDSPEFGKGGSWSFTASRPGTYRYYCAVHPDMKASFTVLAAAAPSPTPPSSTPTAGRTAAAATRPARQASRGRAAAPVATPVASAVVSTAASPSPSRVAAHATEPQTPTKTLDPTLLLVAITVGAVAMALLALGRRLRGSTS
jgi:plastocyanin